MGQKRKRLALSCVDCRRRKVKCDRTYPICVRCEKGGNADSCTYVSHTGLEPGLPTPSEDSPRQNHRQHPQVTASGEPYVVAALRELSPHIEVQSSLPAARLRSPRPESNNGMMRNHFGRAAQLETFTRSAGSKPVPIPFFAQLDENAKDGTGQTTNPAADLGKVLVRGTAFSTHYYGPSYGISMLLQFEELSKFVKGMLSETPYLAGLKEKMNAIRVAARQAKSQSQVDPNPTLLEMVPPRSVTDKLLDLYLSTIETTYRVLHVPKFKQEYEAYWQDPSTAKKDFVVLLLLVMACMYNIAPDGPTGFVGRSSARREVASRWIRACDAWLDEQSQKHVTLAHFQAHVLVLLARAINCIKIKREWTASGRLLRFAMAVGMHREPSLLSKRIDVYHQEMRRRLWYTIVELDLLTTIARGMPPTIDSFNWDCVPPRNIDDEEFDEDAKELPPSKRRSVYTRTSFLNVAAESLPLRVEVLGRINSIRLGLDLEAVMQYDNKLRGVIDDLPTWETEADVSFARKLSILSLYDFSLVLHIPFASQSQNKAKFFYSIASKRDISFKILRLYSDMSREENLLFSDIRDDACRACLSLTHDIVTNSQVDGLLNHDQAVRLVENVVDILGKRFATLGQGFHSYWITLSSCYLLRSKVYQTQSEEVFAQEAATRVVELFEDVISQQIPMPLPNGDAPTDTNWEPTNIASVGTSLGSLDASFPDFEQMNFFDDPFSDMNFDMSIMLNADGFGNF